MTHKLRGLKLTAGTHARLLMITFDRMRGCVVLNVIIIVGRAAVNCDDVNKVLKKTF